MKKIINSALVLLVFVTLTGCSKKENIEPNKEIESNTNENVIADKKLDDLTFTNTNLITENGVSELTTTVTNNSDIDITIDTFKILIRNKNGDIVKETVGYIGGIIKSKGSKMIITSMNIDLGNAYDIEYLYNL